MHTDGPQLDGRLNPDRVFQRRDLGIENSFTIVQPSRPIGDAQSSVVSVRTSTTPTSTVALPSSTSARSSSSSATISLLTPSSTSSRTSSSTLPLVLSTENASPTTEDFPSTTTSTITQQANLPSTSTAPSASSSSTPNSFLANKPVAGAVFGTAGLIILILFVVVVTYGIRRSRRSRLESIISFDPDVTSNSNLIETGSGIERRGGSQVDAVSARSPHDSSYPDYGQGQQYSSANIYPGPPPPLAFPQQQQQQQQQQQYYNAPQQFPTWSQPPPYNIPSTLRPGQYVNSDAVYNGQAPAPAQVYPSAAPYSAPRQNNVSSNSLAPSATISRDLSQRDAVDRSPPSPPLPNPYANMALPPPPKGQQQYSNFQSAVPTAAPLPPRFGPDDASSMYSSETADADAQFWNNTLRVTNQ